jgi:hypothetical protein
MARADDQPVGMSNREAKELRAAQNKREAEAAKVANAVYIRQRQASAAAEARRNDNSAHINHVEE